MDPQRIRDKLTDLKAKDENNFYNLIKSLQGFVEKVMISYKNLHDKNITISQYVEKYGFKNPPDLIMDMPIRVLPIECIVGLYEEIEAQISSKIFNILPDSYK